MLEDEKLVWEVLPHPLHSPDTASSDKHIFRSTEHFLRGKKFTTETAIQKAIEEYFNLNSLSFFKGIEIFAERWAKIINDHEDYIID